MDRGISAGGASTWLDLALLCTDVNERNSLAVRVAGWPKEKQVKAEMFKL